MEDKEKSLMVMINKEEYQRRVLDCITSDEINKVFNSTVFKDSLECKHAMIHGMIIASMMTSQCKSIGIEVSCKNKEGLDMEMEPLKIKGRIGKLYFSNCPTCRRFLVIANRDTITCHNCGKKYAIQYPEE